SRSAKKAGQNKTEPKESRQLKAFCPLRSFIGETSWDSNPVLRFGLRGNSLPRRAARTGCRDT
ncbi:hypothetical protein, partial [Ensifer sp. Root558]|uniref:hypothetical protein n=1 Tax=Ensifer sp. Root558 TaxID=1736558 RepID=UPI001AECCED6